MKRLLMLFALESGSYVFGAVGGSVESNGPYKTYTGLAPEVALGAEIYMGLHFSLEIGTRLVGGTDNIDSRTMDYLQLNYLF